MTTVRVRFTPNGTPTPGQISFVARHDEDNRPIVSGRDILDGNPEWEPVPVEGADVEVRPNDPGWHYVVRVKPDGHPQKTGTFTIPPNGPINFGDLVRYDPKAGVAYEPDPGWYARLAGVEVGFEAVQADVHTARDQAVTAATNAATHAATATTARNQAVTARDQTIALGLTVNTNAGHRVTVGNTPIYYTSGWRNMSSTVPTWGWITVAKEGEGVWVRRLLDSIQVRVVGTTRQGPSATEFGEIVWNIPPEFFPRFPTGTGRDLVPVSAVIGHPGATTTFIYSRRSSQGRVWVDRILPLGTEVNFVATVPIEAGLPNSLPGAPA